MMGADATIFVDNRKYIKCVNIICSFRYIVI